MTTVLQDHDYSKRSGSDKIQNFWGTRYIPESNSRGGSAGISSENCHSEQPTWLTKQDILSGVRQFLNRKCENWEHCKREGKDSKRLISGEVWEGNLSYLLCSNSLGMENYFGSQVWKVNINWKECEWIREFGFPKLIFSFRPNFPLLLHKIWVYVGFT